MKQAKFCIGQIIHHQLFDYRGVIVDVNAVFSSTEEWYENVAKSHLPKDEPWYNVLVDDSRMQTYVAEQNIEPAATPGTIKHPMLSQYFHDYIDDRYALNNIGN